MGEGAARLEVERRGKRKRNGPVEEAAVILSAGAQGKKVLRVSDRAFPHQSYSSTPARCEKRWMGPTSAVFGTVSQNTSICGWGGRVSYREVRECAGHCDPPYLEFSVGSVESDRLTSAGWKRWDQRTLTRQVGEVGKGLTMLGSLLCSPV